MFHSYSYHIDLVFNPVPCHLELTSDIWPEEVDMEVVYLIL